MAIDNEAEGMKHFFNHHFNRLGVGLITMITGNEFLKFGVGKSYTAIRIGEILDEDYRDGTTALVKIVHTAEEFLKAMEYIEKKGKRGQVLIIDEAGLLVNAREWHSMINKSISDVAMTFRVLKCMAIFIAPQMSVVDKNIREFTNVWIICEKVIKQGYPKVRAKPYRLKWSHTEKGKFRRHNITMFLKGENRICKFKTLIVDYPHNQALIDAYETKSLKYKRQIRQDIARLAAEKGENDDFVQLILDDPNFHHEKAGAFKVYPEEIRAKFNITQRKSNMIARLANEELKKNGRREASTDD